jgi:hypothetical protein
MGQQTLAFLGGKTSVFFPDMSPVALKYPVTVLVRVPGDGPRHQQFSDLLIVQAHRFG